MSSRLAKIATLIMGTLLSSAMAVSIAAAAPYYFLDTNSNKQKLYTNPSCGGETSSCLGFGVKCGIDLYYSEYSEQMALDMWKYKGYIKIRINSGDQHIVCEMIR